MKQMGQEDKQTNFLRYCLAYFPIILILSQSYFRDLIIKNLISFSFLTGESLYWIIRISLFIFFLLMLHNVVPEKVNLPAITEDVYEKIRALQDPLLGVRAMAGLNVFLGHWFLVTFCPTLPAQNWIEYVQRVCLSFSPWGGVWMFFTLSGYLMGKGFVTGRHSISKEGIIRFYKNRILRIFPIYFLSMFLVAVFVRPVFLDISNYNSFVIFLESIFFDQLGNGPIGALWSVSTEFQFYLVVPFAYFLMSKFLKNYSRVICFSTLLLFSFCIAKFWILFHYPNLWHSRIYFPVLSNFDCFLVGMSTAFLVNFTREKGFYMKHGVTIGVLLVIIFQCILSMWSYPEMIVFPGIPGSSTRIYFLSIAPGISALVISIIIFVFESSVRTERKRKALFAVFSFLGTMTYCLYVWHEPVILSLRTLFPPQLTLSDSIRLLPFGFFIAFAVAFIFYTFVEKHFDKMRITDRKNAA